MEIKRLNYPVLNNPREALLLPDGSGKVKGRIGEMEFEAYIVGQPRK